MAVVYNVWPKAFAWAQKSTSQEEDATPWQSFSSPSLFHQLTAHVLLAPLQWEIPSLSLFPAVRSSFYGIWVAQKGEMQSAHILFTRMQERRKKCIIQCHNRSRQSQQKCYMHYLWKQCREQSLASLELPYLCKFKTPLFMSYAISWQKFQYEILHWSHYSEPA